MSDKLKDMRNQVKEELSHIRRGDLPQNEMRMVYWLMRMNSLGKKRKGDQTKEDILKIAIADVKKTYPDFEAQYDSFFFNVGSLTELETYSSE